MYLPPDICSLILYYEAIEVKVVQSGTYSFVVNGINNSFAKIYKNKFNPFNPYENLHSSHLSSCDGNKYKLIADLQADTTYVLVVSTDSPSVTAAFSIIVSGPNKTSLSQLSEYFYCFANN
jgi:hypothetical protein